MSWSTPTSFMKRFGDALQLLCSGHRPPEEMMLAWFDKTKDDNRLQEFCCEHGPDWAQGIGMIDAAQVMADQPTEIRTPDSDLDHEHRPNPACVGTRPTLEVPRSNPRAICPQCGKFRLVGGTHAGNTGFICRGLKSNPWCE